MYCCVVLLLCIYVSGEYVSGHRYQLKPTVSNDILQLIPEDVDLHAHRAAHYALVDA